MLSAARTRSATEANYSLISSSGASSSSSSSSASLRGVTLFVSGASRGIGLAIALRAARDGANVIIAAKTVTAQATLPGTIYTAAAEIEAAGGRALAVQCDIRSEQSVQAAIDAGVARFGGIDILVNKSAHKRCTASLLGVLSATARSSRAALFRCFDSCAVRVRSR